MIVACRGCAYRFEALGYRDAPCPVCGEITPTVRACAACTKPLATRRISGVVVETCDACGGMFIDSAGIERVLAEDQEARARAIVEAITSAAPPAITPDPDVPRRCPTCGTTMTRTLASGGSGIVLDVCRPHGTFFDAGELRKMLDFAAHEADRTRGDPAEQPTTGYKPLSHDDVTRLLVIAGGILLAILFGIAH